MKRTSPVAVLALACIFSGAAAAQTYKCRDKAGKVTYTNTQCSELGLKDAGEVPDHINVNPSYLPSAPGLPSPETAGRAPRAEPPRTPPPAAETPAGAQPPSGDDEANPKRRCFVVKTPTGSVTRCNDRPEE
jgi:uncharacterized protein DUF4124